MSATSPAAEAAQAIFAQDGQPFVAKLSRSDDQDAPWNDYAQLVAIEEQSKAYEVDVKTPACCFFVPGDDAEFFKQHPRLVEAAQHVCNLRSSVLLSEHIPRSRGQLARADGQVLRATDQAQSHGRCRQRRLSGEGIPRLHARQERRRHVLLVEELQDAPESMADMQLDEMGAAMAVMHWAAKTDARDVEFVLGCPSKKSKTRLAMNAQDINALESTR
ncbi:Uncharacterized protein TPAR_07178 [Tolypocladium paradoxum]|uniref:DUF3669 domain-containing protein n=1 Tax=Tolypocladium paradoxum TaxID=94208 RepID=A0A2S4KR13_9HYPO|nr:Uncharacterized protein TPAR_07178 [Tolypocladium paradoxum]